MRRSCDLFFFVDVDFVVYFGDDIVFVIGDYCFELFEYFGFVVCMFLDFFCFLF